MKNGESARYQPQQGLEGGLEAFLDHFGDQVFDHQVGNEPHMIAVAVRHATLASYARGWGPARHTDHTSSQEETEDDEKDEEEDEAEEEDEKTDIKSNNPHLTGGE